MSISDTYREKKFFRGSVPDNGELGCIKLTLLQE